MAVNKVVVNGEAIIDLSADTVTANKLAAGYTAHDKSGAVIIGTMEDGGIKLQSIAVTTPPTKTSYLSGESFDPAGMVVEATYSNGAKLACTGYSYEPNTPLDDGTTKVTIRYTEGGVTKTAEQAITVVHRLESIAVTTQPSKTVYEYGDSFASAGMVVTATYSDGATANVTGYTTSPSTMSKVGKQTVTVSYTERGVTKTTTLSVTVERKRIATVPSQRGTLTYTGSAQSPQWNNYDSSKMTLGGVTSGTNAGSYNATFTPTANYRWSDGTTTSKQVAWTIGKAAGSLSISPTSMTLDTTNKTKTITVTRAGDGAITASSSNTAVATVSVSGNIVTVTGKANGSAVITVKVAAGTNHTAPANKTCEVTVKFTQVLNDYTWAQIREISDAGQAANYWSIGDRKAETLNGTVGSLTLNGTYYPFIVDFDHNKSKESPNAHTITFQFAKSALTGGVDIAFVDGRYNSTGSSAAFRMNTTNTNSGGWTGSYMKKTIMPAFKPACSAALRAVIKPVTIYSDNVGGGSNTASNVRASSEEFYLPAEFEVHGARLYANSAEQNYQTQLAYYKAGNSKAKYMHNDTGTAAFVWCRSTLGDYSTFFCSVHASGGANYGNAYNSFGVAPLFNV